MNHTNQSTAVFLINESTRAILVTYEEGDSAPRTMFKTFDQNIEVDDMVIVPTNTRHKMTVCKVVDVDVDVDFNSGTLVEWIIGKVSTDEYQEVVRREKDALKTIRSAEVRREREKLKEALLADLNGSKDDRSIALLAGDLDKPSGE
ncbi:hypothetical protein OEG84_25275 [Hoeflea sp. G2-23]|uniref:Uncharacterized protein n=1 Tax=Hoeflea algicola TaxID=2983763 RepID=A0ABT3ZI82_9HYPH|nr:hypothetical protein [Hoeflea algicola]MCY0150591.1 hypothetical protein [Hoeflea algicola]MCY0150921.1 hypothetical protein [Hoeflea algicola]